MYFLNKTFKAYMYKDILNELRTPVFLLNNLNNIEYINLRGEEFFLKYIILTIFYTK